MELFDNDEANYLTWVQLHPDGWVANADKAKSQNAYPMVHRAAHKIISSDKRSNYTTHDWLKACAVDLSELEMWAKAEYGKELERCGTCFVVATTSPEESSALDNWKDAELEAAVQSYVELSQNIRSGAAVNRRATYRALSEKFGRTAKSFEYRFQNISYVLSLMGRSWIPGLPPARNVGSPTADRIQRFIEAIDGVSSLESASDAIEVRKARKSPQHQPAGNQKPTASTKVVTTYVRDLAVKAWVLEMAQGRCECCDQPAPFDSADGPFLEVHHVRRLCEKGTDTICNAIAACPNCHRRLHYGKDAGEVLESLYIKLKRLKR